MLPSQHGRAHPSVIAVPALSLRDGRCEPMVDGSGGTSAVEAARLCAQLGFRSIRLDDSDAHSFANRAAIADAARDHAVDVEARIAEFSAETVQALTDEDVARVV